jgi:hypothetical protein
MEQNQGRRSRFENSLTKLADQDVEQHTADFKDDCNVDLERVWSKASELSHQDLCSVDDLGESVQLVTKSRKIRN